MAGGALQPIVEHLRRLAGVADPGAVSDAELLGRFVHGRDAAAFELLVWRHGPTVLGVCRRLLRHEQDAEDAFQATFLALARKAHTIGKGQATGSWLYKVAYRVALAARARSARERPGLPADMDPAAPATADDLLWRDLRPVLDAELNRLPEKYRSAIVLCDLEGKTQAEAARLLGCPPGTVAVRLMRGRARLRGRLTQRGLAPCAAFTAAALAARATASLSVALVHPTLTLALAFAAGTSAGNAAAPVVLARGVLRTMFLTRIRNVGLALAAAVLLTLAGALAYPSPAAQRPAPPPTVKAVDRPKATAADVAAAAEGNRRFALDLYARLRQKDGNLFFSPYSISTALAMTYAGARGDTAAEMARTLHLGLGQERLHPAFAALREQLNGAGKQRRYQLSVANALWGQSGHGFATPFLALTRDHYGAGLREVDFRTDTEQARRTINAWVESQTETRIKELLRPGVLTKDTRLVLTNAIFFRGDWARQFKKDETSEENFYVTAERAVKVPMMRQSGAYRYLRTDKLRAVELPYSGGELAMLLLVPPRGDGLAELERRLTADNLKQWSAMLQKQDGLTVALPRFEVHDEMSLKPVLSDMGMPLAFSPSADFSGMTGRQELFLSAVIHKAFVKVSEEGTEAAAATAVAMEPEDEPPGIRADRPFLFLIRDTRSGSILFLGRVVNPRPE